ncbi:MAG: hypothetical protein NTZ09_05255 [Candidatus Hydrogenedentes bacterium]|nr:hypothetical protein [Candidatus Hydrogenedentota bacterium]
MVYPTGMNTEPDSNKIRRKILLRALSAPATLAPFVGGVTAMVAAWAMGLRPEVGVLAGLAGVLGSAGAFLTKIFIGGETLAQEALEEAVQEENVESERALDELDARLCEDKDPRTEAQLRDLRNLMRAFDELAAANSAGLSAVSTVEIESGVEALFDQCVQSLERSLKLYHTAARLKTPAARAPILKQRDAIIEEVARSLSQLGQVLVAIQNLGSGEGAVSELSKVGEELDQRLAVARQVERRFKAFESQLESRGRN